MGLNVKKITFFKTNFLSRFSKKKEGSTAIEFALLILPFSALLFAIIETAVVFFISSTLGHALSETSRPIRVGDFQRDCSDTPERFKAAMCENMISIGSCENQLSVDLVASADGKFNINLLPPLPPEDPATPDEETPPLPSTYQTSAGGDVIITRARFHHRLVLPGNLTFLANRNGNIRVIESTTAFRNEPFENTCP